MNNSRRKFFSFLPIGLVAIPTVIKAVSKPKEVLEPLVKVKPKVKPKTNISSAMHINTGDYNPAIILDPGKDMPITEFRYDGIKLAGHELKVIRKDGQRYLVLEDKNEKGTT